MLRDVGFSAHLATDAAGGEAGQAEESHPFRTVILRFHGGLSALSTVTDRSLGNSRKRAARTEDKRDSICDIAGSAVPAVKMLELPGAE